MKNCDILLVHVHYLSPVTINVCYDEIHLQYVFHNLLVHIIISYQSSFVLVTVLYIYILKSYICQELVLPLKSESDTPFVMLAGFFCIDTHHATYKICFDLGNCSKLLNNQNSIRFLDRFSNFAEVICVNFRFATHRH